MSNRFLLFVLLLPIVGACSDDEGNASTPSVTAPISTSATTPSVSDQVAVVISDFKFDPQTVNVPAGGSVVWTNNDGQQHTTTSAGNFDAGAIDPQAASGPVTFDTPGTFTYICSFHPFMTGTVVVG